MRLARRVAQRTILSLISLAGAILFIFLVTHMLPGNPLIARVTLATPDVLAQIERQLGLDRPLHIQFLSYAKGLVHGDLGESWVTSRPVAADLRDRLPASLELATAGTILAFGVGLPLGVLAAVKKDSLFDQAVRLLASVGVSMPVFWLGLVLIFILYSRLHWAAAPLGRIGVRFTAPESVTGFMAIDTLLANDIPAFWDVIRHIFLPSLTLALVVMAPIVRITRAAMLENLGHDFVNTARAVGIPYHRIVLEDVLRNSLVAVLTEVGLVFGFLVSGSLLVERVFSWPGVGLYAFRALVNNDFAAIQGFTLLTTVMYVAINWLVDVLYGVVDPRIRV